MKDEWRTRAACKGADPNSFFPPVGIEDEDYKTPQWAATYERSYAEARAICASCPVIQECGDWVERNPQPYGLWAGLTPQDRRRIRRNRRAAARGQQRKETTI